MLTFFPETIYTQINSLALLEDGRILAGGIAASDKPSSDNMTVVRYLPNGTIDGTFGKEGKVYVPFGGDTTSTITKLFVKPDGTILLTGGTLGSFVSDADLGLDFVLVQLQPDGAIDSSFGSHGRIITDLNNGFTDQASGAVMQSDGDVVVTGSSFKYSSESVYYYALARYNTGTKAQRPIVIKAKRFLHNHGIEWNAVEGASYYSIERSSGAGFREMSRVSGSSGRQTYTYPVPASSNTNANANEFTYSYRVTAVSNDGRSLTSNLITLPNGGEPALNIYPNPATYTLTINGLNRSSQYRFSITNAGGTVYMMQDIRQQSVTTCDVSTLKKGNYFIRLSNGTTNQTFTFIKE